MRIPRMQICVGRGDSQFKSWTRLTGWLGHDVTGVDVAKIDIEGHESSVLAELRHDTLLPRQVRGTHPAHFFPNPKPRHVWVNERMLCACVALNSKPYAYAYAPHHSPAQC